MIYIFILLLPLLGFSEDWKLDAGYSPQMYGHKQTGSGLVFDTSTNVMKSFYGQIMKRVGNWRLLADYNYASFEIKSDDGKSNVSLTELHIGGFWKRFYIGYEQTKNPYFFDDGNVESSELSGHWADIGYRMPVGSPNFRLEAHAKMLLSDVGSDSDVKNLSGYGGSVSAEYWDRISRSLLWNIKATYQMRSFDIESDKGDEKLQTTQAILLAGLGVLF